MEEGGRKLDPNSLPGLGIVIREEQLSIQRRLADALDRIATLEREVKRLKEQQAERDQERVAEHDISTG